MSLRSSRKEKQELIAKGKYVSSVLKEFSSDVEKEIGSLTSGFRNSFWSNTSFTSNHNEFTYTHTPQHRFVDMKTIETKSGRVSKKNHKIHNQPLFGITNNTIRQLAYGYVDSVKATILLAIE